MFIPFSGAVASKMIEVRATAQNSEDELVAEMLQKVSENGIAPFVAMSVEVVFGRVYYRETFATILKREEEKRGEVVWVRSMPTRGDGGRGTNHYLLAYCLQKEGGEREVIFRKAVETGRGKRTGSVLLSLPQIEQSPSS